MHIIHTDAKTFPEAYQEAQQRKASPEGVGMIHKVVKARYGDGYDIVVIEPSLFADMVTGKMPAIPQLREYSKLGDFGI